MEIVELVPGHPAWPAQLFLWPVGQAQWETDVVKPEDGKASRQVLSIKERALSSATRETAEVYAFTDAPGERYVKPSELMYQLVRNCLRRAVEQCGDVAQFRFATPAIEARDRNPYVDIIERAVRFERGKETQPRVLTEPDAVLQYFRLVRKQIPAAKGFQAYLVVDSGAGTTNFCVVFKGKGEQLSAGSGRVSRGPLTPVVAVAPTYAGNFINRQLAEMLEGRLRSQLKEEKSVPQRIRRSIGERVEQLKLDVCRQQRSMLLDGVAHELGDDDRWAKLASPHLELSDVERATRSMWKALDPTLEQVLRSTYAQIRGAKKYHSVLDDRGIDEPAKIPLLFSRVIMAGGSSQLPGFRDELEARLREAGGNAEILTVEDDYQYAVAAGLAAHAVHTQRLQEEPAGAAEPEAVKESSEFGRPDVAPREMFRLVSDVGLVVKRGSGPHAKYRLRKVFSADEFPLRYQVEDVDPSKPETTIKLQKVPKQGLKFGLARIVDAESEAELSSTSFSEEERCMLSHDTFWHHLATCPKRIDVTVRFDDKNGELQVRIYDGASKKNGGPAKKPLLTLVSPLQDSAREAEGKRRFEERQAAAAKGKRKPAKAAGKFDLCFDIGTSKIVCVLATPGLDFVPPAREQLMPEVVDGASVRPVATEDIVAPTGEHRQVHAPPVEVLAAEEPAAEQPAKGPESRQLAHPIWKVDSEPNLVAGIVRYVNQSGLALDTREIVNLHLSLKVSPLAILAGPPGIGKSSLARLFPQSLGASEERESLTRVAVEACWTDSNALFGETQPSPLMRLLQASRSRSDELFYVILDEMNLAHVEYYLSQVLSAMSDDGRIYWSGHSGGGSLVVPLRPPEHRVFLLGTVNVDDAATTLSDKVLDRANVIELPVVPPPDTIPARLRMAPDDRVPTVTSSAFTEICSVPDRLDVPEEIIDVWNAITAKGTDFRLVFGARVVRDIAAYMRFAQRLQSDGLDFDRHVALDFQVCQRILPRIRGDTSLKPLLLSVRDVCRGHGLPKATTRAQRMLDQLEAQYVTSFWTS